MALMRPYYSDRLVTLYNDDCAEVLPHIPPESVDLLLTDPPYGVNENTYRRQRERSALTYSNDFPPVYGDDEPFNPIPLLRFPRVVLFGANYYAHLLPPSSAWIIWDKLNGLEGKRTIGFNDNADCEMAWTNLGGPARIFRHRWMGAMKESEHRSRRVHPTQKPIQLMNQIIEWRTVVRDHVLDPYAGSGSTVIGAVDAGCKVTAIEISMAYCDIIVDRLQTFYAKNPEVRYA